ncbi:MAG: hypothetical protein ACFFCZ_21930 [Promethearchaeota archaeon]
MLYLWLEFIFFVDKEVNYPPTASLISGLGRTISQARLIMPQLGQRQLLSSYVTGESMGDAYGHRHFRMLHKS